MDKQLVPKENIEIYCYLYSIETALRELIIDLLKTIDGSQWYKKRLPSGSLEKYRNGIEYERNIKWTQLIPHHPIYYIEFPDLKEIIKRKDNWNDAFKKIFVREDILISTLSELEPIRNKIAHNRKVTYKDVEIVKGAYIKLSDTIGKKKFDELTSRCTCAMDIFESLTELQRESEKSILYLKNYKPLEKFKVWESVCDKWWLDESYLGYKLDRIFDYFKTLEEYANLPWTRGSGHKIEEWVKHSNIDEKYNKAQEEFKNILNSWR